MFERFSADARQAVVAAQEEAVGLRHGWIGTEHLVLGLLAAGGDGARLLEDFGLGARTAREEVVSIVGRGEDDMDADALATLGIDLDAVRERVERAFGPGALLRRSRCRSGPRLPFTPRAKKALELTLREGIALGTRELRGDHVVLGVLREADGVGARILTAHGMRLEAVRERVRGRPAA